MALLEFFQYMVHYTCPIYIKTFEKSRMKWLTKLDNFFV
jgi:hypothetical protein